MKRITKNEVKTWIQNNKKKLIIGSSIVAATATTYFVGKKLLDNDKIASAIVRKLMKNRINKHRYCCSVVGSWVKKGITDEQANQIIDEAAEKFEEIYRAGGFID